MSHAFLPTWPRGCWPDETQQLLLKACLLQDEAETRAAFTEWAKRVPLFFIDSGSLLLLLLLYERLSEWQLPYAEMPRLRGMVRYCWVRHQTITRQLFELTETFRDIGFDVMLLKGAALNQTAYSGGTRMMSDLDIAVPRSRAYEAMEKLERLGWESQFREPARLVSVTHGCHYRRGDSHLDLHWDFFHGRPLSDDEQLLLWDAANVVTIGDAKTRVLCPTDQLLHTCEHGVRYNETPPFRWLADALLIVRHGDIDWQRLSVLSSRFGLVQPVALTLSYLREQFAAGIPQHALEMLDEQQSSLASRLEFYFTTRRMPGIHPFARGFPCDIFNYRRIRRHDSSMRLSDYLALVNDLELPLSSNLKPIFKLELSAARSYWKNWLTHRLSVRKSTTRDIQLDQFSDEAWQGFHAPETTPQGTIRWSKDTASVSLPIRQSSTVILHLAEVRPWHGDLCESLSFRVNRTPVPASSVRFDNWNVSFDIEPDMLLDYHQQRLELRCPRWNMPSDPRTLGVPVCEIKLLPKCA